MVVLDLVVFTIFLALLFDFINGFHDTANAIATVVATRVLTPVQAVLMAGFFNFVGPFVFSLAVANTVGKGIIDKEGVTTTLILAALVGAIVWDLMTWWWGLPTSSSHALAGGLVGASFAASGLTNILMPTGPEFQEIGVVLAKGGIGGLVFGGLMIAWSRLRFPRSFLPILMAMGVLALGYFSYAHSTYDQDLVKGLMLNFVFMVIGAVGGAMLWAGSQQNMSPRTSLSFILPAACGTLAFSTLLGTIALGGLTKVVVFMIVSPVLGFYAGFLFNAVLQWIWRRQSLESVNHWSRRLQLGSSAFYALTHGTNDAQKTMGIIGVLLFSAGTIGLTPSGNLDIPTWVILASASAMGFGTAFGGWRIIRTMASRITDLKPHQGFAAETGGGVVLVAMAESGIPVSTTHAITSSIMGVGASRRATAVKWNVGRQMFIAWILTIPASGIVAWGCYYVVDFVLQRAA